MGSGNGKNCCAWSGLSKFSGSRSAKSTHCPLKILVTSFAGTGVCPGPQENGPYTGHWWATLGSSMHGAICHHCCALRLDVLCIVLKPLSAIAIKGKRLKIWHTLHCVARWSSLDRRLRRGIPACSRLWTRPTARVVDAGSLVASLLAGTEGLAWLKAFATACWTTARNSGCVQGVCSPSRVFSFSVLCVRCLGDRVSGSLWFRHFPYFVIIGYAVLNSVKTLRQERSDWLFALNVPIRLHFEILLHKMYNVWLRTGFKLTWVIQSCSATPEV